MKKPSAATFAFFLAGMAWATETDEEIIRYLDFYQNLEMLSDQNTPSLDELNALDTEEKESS